MWDLPETWEVIQLLTKGDFNAAILGCLSQISVLNPEFILVSNKIFGYDDSRSLSEIIWKENLVTLMSLRVAVPYKRTDFVRFYYYYCKKLFFYSFDHRIYIYIYIWFKLDDLC